ncbi:MAG: tetratricopeptide repeat protein [Pseudomonadota bacterium]
MNKHSALSTATLVQQIASLAHGTEFEQGLQMAQTAIAQNLQDGNVYQLAGVCAVHLGLPQQAEDFWRKALAVSPMHAEVHANLAVLLHEARRLDEAAAFYRSALQLDAANAYLHARFAVLLASQKQNIRAEHHYRQALALDPADAGTHANLGVLLDAGRKYAEAESCYRRALQLDPGNAATHVNLGLLLAKQGALQAAQQCYMRALELEPGNAAAFSNLGLLLEQESKDELAEQCHRKAVLLAPESEEALCNLGNLLAKLHRYQEAESIYRLALAAKAGQHHAGSAATHTSLGVLLTDTARADEAEACFRLAMQLDADYPLAASNLALLLLQQGRYAEAWPYYEARHAALMRKPVPRPPLACGPLWQGEDVRGKSILVWPEQGLGDMIHFCRYIPILKQRGAAQVTLVCYPSQQTLLSTLAGVDACIRLGDENSLPAHDYSVLMMSLPGYLQTPSGPVLAALPYLQTLPARNAYWARHLQDLGLRRQGLRVGLAWKGNPDHANDNERSLTTLDQLAPLWRIPGIQWISLQKTSDAVAPPDGLDPQAWLAPGPELRDFGDTAAITAMLDLIICVDTSIAHLAGALGKACWLLLPAYKADWRWQETAADTPWYPGVMRLFRQPQRGDWTSPVDDIASKLQAHLAGGYSLLQDAG